MSLLLPSPLHSHAVGSWGGNTQALRYWVQKGFSSWNAFPNQMLHSGDPQSSSSLRHRSPWGVLSIWGSTWHAFCKGPENNHFQLCRVYGLRCKNSTLPLQCGSSHSHHLTKDAGLCPTETLFTKNRPHAGSCLWAVVVCWPLGSRGLGKRT